MGLLTIRNNRTITILKPRFESPFEKIETIEIPIDFEFYFVDCRNILYVVSDRQLYILESTLVHVNLEKMETYYFSNMDDVAVLYFIIHNKLFVAALNDITPQLKLVKELDGEYNIAVTDTNIICLWSKNKFLIINHNVEITETLPFEIKEIKSNLDKLVVFDIKNNIYILNLDNQKLEGGLKSIGPTVLAQASSKYVDLVTISIPESVYILDTSSRSILKTLDFKDVTHLKFISTNELMLCNDKLWIHDFLSDENICVYDTPFQSFSYFNSNSNFNINRDGQKSIILSECQNEMVLELRADTMKQIFDLRVEIDRLKMRIADLESKK